MARKTHTEAQARYDKVNRRVYGFRLHNVLDADIIDKLASVPSMQGYIKQLIREDLARTDSVPKTEKKEGIVMKRTYGNTRTHLTLEGKALDFYNITDPIRIDEIETEDGDYQYLIYSGADLMHDGVMTEQQLIKFMEAGYDEYLSECVFHIKPEYLNMWGNDATEETTLTYKDIMDITRGWNKTPYDVINQLIID